MAKFTFSASSKPSNVIRIKLTKHDRVKGNPEYYTYISSDGNEEKYDGVVTKLIDENGETSYKGKIINTHKVVLNYHPSVTPVEHVDEYFSYLDNNGNERIFTGTPKFDLEQNTYFGEVNEEILHDEVIDIYKEIK